jgi:hypothetical protein
VIGQHFEGTRMMKRLLELLSIKKWWDRRSARARAGGRPEPSQFPRYPDHSRDTPEPPAPS